MIISMVNGKHAYLIIAHNNFMVLDKLLQLLDDERNDIYIHIDKKADSWDLKKYIGFLHKSNVLFIKRERVRWGGYSQVHCELELLKTAAAKHYDYYHLLSGADLPLKTQDYIHDFFDTHAGKEFIHFDNREYNSENDVRVKYYHFLRGVRPRPNLLITRAMIKLMDHILLLIQALLRIDRIRRLPIHLQKGASWFSITDSLVGYIISKEDMIRQLFRFTSCGDEMFLHTLVWNSEYRSRLYYPDCDNNYKACMRYIDWNRGKPYIWRTKDYEDLMKSGYLFARKFDTKADFQIVERIYDHLIKHQEVAEIPE